MERKRSTRRGYPSRRRKPLGEKIKDFLRHFVAFMFSNVGIIGLVVGYTIVGALIFQRIEGDNPVVQNKREDAGRLINATADKLWNLTCCGVIPLVEDVWREEVTKLVQIYQNELVKTMKSQGSDSAKSTDNWSFSGAFLYSLTVITTIGYGNVTPRSEWGKITTVLYAIVGMPLFLLYLSNIGDILAKSFKWTYAKLWLCKGCPGARRRRLMRAMQQAGGVPASKYNLKAVPSVVADFGDDHSWTPGAHPASLPYRGRPGVGAMVGGVVAGVHDPYHDVFLEAESGAPRQGRHRRQKGARGPRGRRGHPLHQQDDDEEDDEEDAARARTDWRGQRVRRVGVDYGRDGVSDEEDEEDDWEDASARSPSRSAFRQGPQSAAGRTPSPTPMSDPDGPDRGWARGRGPRRKSGDDLDLEAGFHAPRRPKHRAHRAHRPPGPRQRRGRQEVEEEEEDSEEAEEEEEETPSTEDLDEAEEEEVEEEEDAEVDDGEVADEDTDGESSSQSSESYDPQTVTVPVTLCLAIMVGYVCGGAVLFSKWEEWDMLDGSYFCFISLSTIGFGDIVPGGTVYSDNIEVSFIFCSMYLMLGMALIAMCFNLMQEEVIHKMRSCIRTLRYVTRCNRRRAAAS